MTTSTPPLPVADESATDSESRVSGTDADWRWPVRGPEAVRLLVAFVAVVGSFVAVGYALTDWFAPNAVTRLDVRLAESLADGRTPTMNDVAHWSAFPADTIVKIAASALICGAFLWLWRRWDEAVYVALPLVFEASAFIVITWIVKRPRPDVERLLDSPVNSSFPSGHVAAATVYLAVAVVIARHTRRRAGVVAIIAAVGAIVIAVAWARMYQGMHFLSDVVFGVLLGLVTLVITDRVLDTSRMGEVTDVDT
jgi:undecaprenyl-diphosphatase